MAVRNIPLASAPTAATLDEPDEVGLYEIRRKIYPRAVSGRFASWRVAMVVATQMVFYGIPWLLWNDRQAVLFDLAARKFYIFGLVFWPQDVIYLTVLLILSALSLFLFTAVAGRVWCGFACPQTVYTEIFLWIERHIEGDRLARIRLDAEPLSARKIARKAAKHGIWIALSLWTGITFVGYFMPIRELVSAIPFDLGATQAFWVLFYGFATYGNAGWMREQVCKYMCPYARFQSVMFDRDTLIIAYDARRGEPKGPRGKRVDPRAAGLGDCIDCKICVQVCPTGIDIRDGLQYECIGCAACVDGCDQVMDKMGYPRGLIRYASQNTMTQDASAPGAIWRRVLRPRTLIYAAILAAIAAAAGTTLLLRNPLKVDVIRDRGALAREASPGVMENVYRLQIINTTEAPQRFEVRAEGLPGLAVAGVTQPIEVAAGASRLVALRLQAPSEAAAPGSHKVELIITAQGDAGMARREASTFIMPRP